MKKYPFQVLRRFFSDNSTETIINHEEISLEEANKTKSTYLRHLEDEFIFENPKTAWKYEIIGKEFQAINIELEPKQAICARAGTLSYMTEGIALNMEMSGGLSASINRIASGSSGYLMGLKNYLEEGTGKVMLAPQHPSKVIGIDLKTYDGKLLCHKDSFLCGEDGIKVTSNYI